MKTSGAGRTAIESEEGCRLDVYQDIAGVWTIGYGHTRGVTRDTPRWTQAQADAALAADLQYAERVVLTLGAMPQCEFDALVSLAFNIGDDAFAGSTLVHELAQGHRLAAGAQFLEWIRAGGAISRTLIRRRTRELLMFLGVS